MLMRSYFWLIVALYLASYESEGPENHIEKDRWKSLRWVSWLLLAVLISRGRPSLKKASLSVGCPSLCVPGPLCLVSCSPNSPWLKILVAIIPSYCSLFFLILADLYSACFSFYLPLF